MNKTIYKQGMILFAKAFPAKVVDFDLCWEMLKDIPNDAYIRAIKRIMAGHEEIFQSTNLIALIRKNAFEEVIPLAGDAWAEVLREINKTGSMGSPEFSHPIIARAVEGVGWRNLCMSETIGVERAHFYRIYDQLRAKAEREGVAPDKLIHDSRVKELIDKTTKDMNGHQ